MALQSNPERVAVRLAPYIGELHEFFTSRSMRFGSPEDLAPIALLLSVPGSFQDEMASMIRSILYREQGTVPHGELLELVTVAIGGPHVDEAAQELYGPVRQLLAFISGVLRSKRSPSFHQPEVESGTAEKDLEEPVAPSSSHQISANSDEAWADSTSHVCLVSAELNPNSGREPSSKAAMRPNPEVYFRASSILSNPGEPALVEDEDIVPSVPVMELADTKPVRTSPDLVPPQVEAKPVRHNLISWAIALGLIPTFLFLNMYLNHRSAVSSSQTTAASDDSAATDIPSTASQPSAQAKSSPSVALGPPPPPNTAARQAYPADSGSARRTSPSPVARQESAAPLPDYSSPRASPLADLQSSAADVAPYPKPLADEPSRSVSAGVPMGHPARSRPYPRPGSFAVSSGVMAGNLVSSPGPKYPKLAGLVRVEGQVILQAVVSRDGSVVDTRVIRGPRLLRGAATQAVRRWRYRPYILNGRATDVATIVTVDFRLHR